MEGVPICEVAQVIGGVLDGFQKRHGFAPRYCLVLVIQAPSCMADLRGWLLVLRWGDLHNGHTYSAKVRMRGPLAPAGISCDVNPRMCRDHAGALESLLPLVVPLWRYSGQPMLGNKAAAPEGWAIIKLCEGLVF